MRKLFVMGGGGFAMEPENLLLDRYLLSLSNKADSSGKGTIAYVAGVR